MAAEYDALLNVGKVFKRIPPLHPLARRYNMWRHAKIMHELEPLLEQSFSLVQGARSLDFASKDEGPLWVFWWQGEDRAPWSVRACFESIRRNCGRRKVVVISQGNISEFVDFPQRIFDLVDDGAITATHFSDLLRYRLLRRYGGFWMDASMFASGPFFAPTAKSIYTVLGIDDPTCFNVALSRWLGGYFGGPAGHPHFKFVDSFFSRYWERHDRLIDYFLIDYAVTWSYNNNIGGFAEDCGAIQDRQPKLFALRQHLNQPFNEDIWKQLSANTAVFMVNYKWLKTISPGSFADVLMSPYLEHV